jgi:tripartite-type tricarboxylate transporter receptor subunit TctC
LRRCKNLTYHPVRDVQPVAQVADFPIILLTSSASPHKTLADVVQAARAAPDSVTYASAGNGTVSHLVVELFQATAGVKVRHIPYKGSGPALVDVMGGQVALLSTSIPTVLSQVKAGKLRPLAVSTARRSAILPDVPTVAEQGFKDFDVGPWYGLFAPAGVPHAVVSQINAEVNKMLQVADVRATLEGQGGEVRPVSPEDLAARLQADIVKWRGVITAANIQLE